MTLERAAGTPGRPPPQPVAAGIAAGLGVVALVVAAIIQFGAHQEITTLPSPWITVPFVAASGGCAIAAHVRRERLRVLGLAGVGASVVAMLLGYIVVASLVALVAVVICAIAAKFM